MYAKLVTNITTFSANVYYNTLMDVITGAITSNSQLDSGLFNQSSSVINTNVASSWSNYDTSANATGTSYILSGCAPRVIRSQISDDASRYKYLWTGAVNSTNTYIQVSAIPAEGWNTSTKVGNNIFSTPPTTTQTSTIWNSFVQFSGSPGSSGTVTIISASQSHLFVAYSIVGASTINNYFLCNEYTRDDPWNTVSNGYPSWLSIGQYSSGFAPTANTGQSHGTLTRILNTYDGTVKNHAPMSATSSVNATLLTRFQDFTCTNPWTSYYPFGLSGATNSNFFWPNNSGNYYIKDSSGNSAIPLAEFKLAMAKVDTTNLGLFAGGSITNKAPYIYGTKASLFNNLDEIVISGTTYTALKLYTGDSTILIKQA